MPRFNFIYFEIVVSIYLKSHRLLSFLDEKKIFSMNSLYIGVKTLGSNSTLHDYYFYLFFHHDLYVFCMNRVLHWPSEMNSESRRCQQSDWWIYIFAVFHLDIFGHRLILLRWVKVNFRSLFKIYDGKVVLFFKEVTKIFHGYQMLGGLLVNENEWEKSRELTAILTVTFLKFSFSLRD